VLLLLPTTTTTTTKRLNALQAGKHPHSSNDLLLPMCDLP
jgi:hypothetical protein